MRKVLLILFVALFQQIHSQVYSFKNFAEDDGLSQSFIYDINQDNRGFLFVGTGDGLSTYGGSKFVVFNSFNGLSENFVTTIYRDSKSRMWTGHFEGGVSILHTDGKIEKITQSSDNSKITQIIEIMPEVYVFLKNITGMVLYNYKTKKYLNIEEDAFTGLLNILVRKNDLLLLKQEGIYTIQISELLKNNYNLTRLKSLKEPVFMEYNMNKDKVIVVDNYAGILSFSNNPELSPIDTFKVEKKESCSFTKPFIDRFNNIYIGTNESGFFKIDQEKGTIKNYTVKNGLKSNSIQSIFIDREDNLWLGTFGKGLQQLNNELYSYNFTFDDEHALVSINSILKHNNKIITATNNGIGYISDNIVSHLNHPKLLNKSFNHIIYHSESFVFSSEEGKLYKSDTLFKEVKEINFGNSDRKILINSLCHNNTDLFICSTAGLIIYNIKNQNFKLLNTENGLLHNNVKFVFEDSKRRLWVCSPGSPVYYLDTDYKQTVFKEVPGMRNFNINSVCEDKKNNIWISTIGDGIFKFNGRAFENYTVINGLKSNYCYGINADSKNGIWVNHINGISYKNLNKKNFNRIGNNTELMQLNFIENSSYYDKLTSEIILGASEGIVKINTSKQHFNEAEPKLNLLSVEINDKTISSLSDTLTLKYGSYDVEINFIGICLTEPNKVKYKYILEGHDDKWQFATYETKKLNFSKLKDGDYTFKILACNNDELWTSNPVIFKFSVKKPFWKEVWFYVLLALVLIVAFALAIKVKTKSLIAEQKKLEAIIQQKTNQISLEKFKVEGLYEEIKSKNKDITDSINYAKRIQEALLPLDKYIKKGFDVAYFYRAKDIVSGDFYWFKKTKNYTFIAVVDCTGHGVPGAFMSFIGSTILDDIVSSNEELNPVDILKRLDAGVIKILNQHSGHGEKNMDGMDISICKFNPKTNILEMSGAVRPIFLYANGELTKIKNTIYSIGGAFLNLDKPFTLTTHKVEPGDNVFLYTDGYVDQAGGEKNKKYSSVRLAEFFMKIAPLPTIDQKKLIETEFQNWKGDNEQVDDVLLMSIKF